MMLFCRDCHHLKKKVRLRHCQFNVIAGVSHDCIDGRRQVSIAKHRSPAICVKISLPDVALFLPFRRTKEGQMAASAGTKRRPKIAGFFE